MSLYDSILITGANGMLGRALTDLLRGRGHSPVTLDRATLDIADPDAMTKAFAAHKPTLVLNCAAHTKVDLCEEEKDKADAINGHAVGRMADLCKRHGAALVHVSTDFVFSGKDAAGNDVRRPYRVDDPVGPICAYGRSKLLGEVELQNHAPDRWLIVRTAWVYGRGGANFPRTMVTVARAGKPLNVVADQFGSPTYAPDLAAAILDLLDAGANGIYQVTNAGETNWHEFARAALQTFGIDHPVGKLSSAEWAKIKPNAAARPLYSVLDLTAFEQVTHRPMRPWREALDEFKSAVDAGGF